ALKHVPLCEYNPFEAMKTNVVGTQNIINTARELKVENLVYISTDKAVNPISTMGTTKLLGEKLISDASLILGTKFTSVRFGNVLGSDGSVIPLFESQIKKGGPVTLTSYEMTRFFMSLSDAVSLVLKSAEISIGGEITILKMKAIKISDLAQSMIELLAPKYGYKPEDVKIKEIGLRAGEKLYEALMTEEEAAAAKETDDMFIIDTMTNYLNNGNNKNKIHKEKYKSDKPKLLSKDEIKSLLIEKKLVAK
ncbi:polysaccharide biosynthesis protein, partial [Candidatus Woesearchaeota archaeon]|nr:polysaccharide biosynthesis protein [Candidatus Woesearchaeota archaeon]